MPVIFADRKKLGAAAAGRAQDGKIETASNEFSLIASEIKKAVRDGSDDDLAKALKAFFYACDARPHEEGPHE
jgi:hypothetical protein